MTFYVFSELLHMFSRTLPTSVITTFTTNSMTENYYRQIQLLEMDPRNAVHRGTQQIHTSMRVIILTSQAGSSRGVGRQYTQFATDYIFKASV